MKTLTLIFALFVFSAPVFSQIDPEKQAIIKTDREDSRYLSTRGYLQQEMRDLSPLLAFNPNLSAGEFERWRTEVRNRTRDLMNFPVVSPQPAPKLISTVQRDGYRVEKWEIYPLAGSVVPILVLVPDHISAENPGPAVLCYPGSYRSKEELAGEPELHPNFKVERSYEKNHMAKFYAQQGIIAIAIDNPGVGEVSDLEYAALAPDYQRTFLSRHLMDLGWHYVGLSAFYGQHTLNWLQTRPMVDKERIALSGHSLGTEPVMMLAVLNPDIKAVVFNDFLTNTVRRTVATTKPNEKGQRPNANSLYHCMPGMWKWFDYADLLASLAPMHLLITEGGVTEDLKTVSKAYTVAGTNENYKYLYYKKYSNPADRIGDEGIPEGISEADWFEYANVDVPNHYFKADIAVPWLHSVLFP